MSSLKDKEKMYKINTFYEKICYSKDIKERVLEFEEKLKLYEEEIGRNNYKRLLNEYKKNIWKVERMITMIYIITAIYTQPYSIIGPWYFV